MRASRELSDRSVVITGASSGIGRATALAFARRGAKLTLLARRERELARLAKVCLRLGASGALAVGADVTDAAALRRAANTAIRQFGRIDVWVNNAGVGAVGRFTEVPLDAHQQVIRTNLLGYVNGAYAVMPHFEQRRRGTLVNVVSFGAFVPAPYAASYSASKFGLRGFSESLRAELQKQPDIHVCDVFPGFVDTPGIQHAGNWTGRELRPSPPDRPEEVADAILRLATHPRDATSVGATAKLAPLGYALMPGLMRWGMAKFLDTGLARTPPAPKGPGALFRPVKAGVTPTGGWRQRPSGQPVRTPASPPLPARKPVPPRGDGNPVARTLGYGLVVAALAMLAGGGWDGAGDGGTVP